MGKVLSKEELITSFLASERINRQLKISGNRIISYSECGPADGLLVFMIPGISGNRLMINGLEDHLSDKSRLIFIDYPGYGNSSFKQNRSVDHFCELFIELLESLQQSATEKFSLIGNSTGGVHIAALLVDKRLKHRINTACLLAPWASTSTKGASISNRIAGKLPVFVTRIVAAMGFYMYRFSLTTFSFSFIANNLESKELFDLLTNKWQVKQECWEMFLKQHFKIINRKGFEETFLLCTESIHKFDFNLNNVHENCKVFVFYGSKDKLVPPAAVESFYRDSLKPKILKNNFKFIKIEGGTHDGVPLIQMENALALIEKRYLTSSIA